MGAQELASRLRHTEEAPGCTAAQGGKSKAAGKAAGKAAPACSGQFYSKEGVTARLELLENDNVKQVQAEG